MNVIGLSEEKVNTTINTFNTKAKGAIDELESQIQILINKIGEDWGTADAKKHAEVTIIPALESLVTQVANGVSNIGASIETTAHKQAKATNNEFQNLKKATWLQRQKKFVNSVNEKLENGFVGVVNTFESDVNKAQEGLISAVIAKLEEMQSAVVKDASEAFLDEQTSVVSQKCEELIKDTKKAIQEAFTNLNGELKEMTKNATQTAKDIQSKGLLAAAGAGAGAAAGAIAGGVGAATGAAAQAVAMDR